MELVRSLGCGDNVVSSSSIKWREVVDRISKIIVDKNIILAIIFGSMTSATNNSILDVGSTINATNNIVLVVDLALFVRDTIRGCLAQYLKTVKPLGPLRCSVAIPPAALALWYSTPLMPLFPDPTPVS